MARFSFTGHRFVRELRENRNFIAASAAAHAAVLGFAFLLPGFAPPREVTTSVVTPVVSGPAVAEAETGEAAAAQPEPPMAAAPLPTPPAPRPEKPRVAKRDPAPVQPAAPADEQVAAVPGPDAAAVGAPLKPAENQEASAASGARTTSGGKELGDDYFDRLHRYLTAYRRYPPDAIKRNQEGTVVVKFEVARDGTVAAAEIQHSSGFPLLDQSVLEMLDRASPVPALPAGFTGDRGHIIMPIAFSIGMLDRFF